MSDDKREELAAFAHDAWRNWMRHMFAQGTFSQRPEAGSMRGMETVWTMPAWAVERWIRQMNMEFSALPEAEKNSDREEADKMLAIINGES